jgi:anti-anti-sigma regulatory factor
MTLAERLLVLESSAIPAWVFDADHFRFRWANTSALEIWGATAKDELLARDFSDMSVSTRARMQGYLAGFRDGHAAQEDWTLYPHGKPLLLRLYFSGIALDDGRTAAFIQAVARESVDADLVRSVEALRHTSVAVTLLDPAGAILLQNPASARAFGQRTLFADRFVEAPAAEALLREANAGETFHAEVRVHTTEGERWHAVEGRGLLDPATGASAILVHETDETERRGAVQAAEEMMRLVEELNATLAVVELQKEEILALSAPILDVASGTLAVPIIGTLNAQRSAGIVGRLLDVIVERRARTVILDLTGADVREASGLDHLTKMVQAIRLLGARSIVAGIGPALARMLTSTGADFAGVLLVQNLKDGITASRRAR